MNMTADGGALYEYLILAERENNLRAERQVVFLDAGWREGGLQVMEWSGNLYRFLKEVKGGIGLPSSLVQKRRAGRVWIVVEKDNAIINVWPRINLN